MAPSEMDGVNGHTNGETSKKLDLKVIGLNCGTSVDGVDCVHVHYTQEHPDAPLKMELLNYDEVPMPLKLKKRVMKAIRDNYCTPEEISQVNYLLGEQFAAAALQFCEKHGIDMDKDVDLIGSHGITIWHLPLPEMFEGDQFRAHLDMGETAIIAARTGKTTISEFRVGDQAYGRQGCPLIAFLDSLLLNHPTKTRACQNIGGIANVCFVPNAENGGVTGCYDFDTGPGNVFIDGAVRFFTNGEKEYDKDGVMGKAGKVDEYLLNKIMAHPYFSHDIPKTTGRETFGDNMAEDLCKEGLERGLSPEDIVATITRVTAYAIVDHYKRYAPGHIDEVFMCGGGSYNPNITDYMKEQLPGTRITMIDEVGVPAGAKEALSFAQLGMECFLGRPVIVPKRVETDTPAVIGKIQPGRNYHKVRKHVSQFWGDYPAEDVKCVTKMDIIRGKF